MGTKEKQELLANEFVSILRQSQEICRRCGEELNYNSSNQGVSQGVLDKYIQRKKLLEQLIEKTHKTLNTIEQDRSRKIIDQDIDTFNAFKLELSKIFNTSGEINEQADEHQKKDVVSEHLSVVDRIQMEVTLILRKVIQWVGAKITGTKLEKEQPNLGETSGAFWLVHRSQFFSRPMRSLNDAKEALDDISTRLNECIESKRKDDKDQNDRLIDSLRL